MIIKVGDVYVRNSVRYKYHVEVVSILDDRVEFTYCSFDNGPPLILKVAIFERDFRRLTKLERALQ